MAKEIISESRLREIISEEAARFKKKLTLEDFARVVRSCEDRYLIEIPKASFLTEMVESTNNHKALEEIQIRYKNYVKTKEH